MKSDFSYFLQTIPQDMYSRTKATISRYVAIFEPEEFAVGEELCVDDYHFILFFSTPPVTRISNVDYQLKKGDMIVVQPWEKVYGVPCENIKNARYIHIAINKTFFQKVAEGTVLEGVFTFKRIQNAYSKQLLELIGNFQRELMDYGEVFPMMVESICTQLVFQLIREINAEPVVHRGKISKDNKYISKAIQFMQEYYNANISINDICNLIYLSPCHFKRVFKDYTGQTPYQYLMGIRLEKAKEFLRKKENTMEEVARLCGFVNSGHFSTVFKRNMNMSPTEYRRMEL